MDYAGDERNGDEVTSGADPGLADLVGWNWNGKVLCLDCAPYRMDSEHTCQLFPVYAPQCDERTRCCECGFPLMLSAV